MSNFINIIERDINKLKTDIESTTKFLKKLERKRSDALRYIKHIEQNLKYMRKRNSVVLAEHFDRANRSKNMIEKEISKMDEQIIEVSTMMKNMIEILNRLLEDLSKLKNETGAKIIPFRKKNERKR